MALGVRNDALTPLAADGDYIPLMFNDKGELVVAANVTAIVTSDVRTRGQRFADNDKLFSIFFDDITIAQQVETKIMSLENPIGSGKTTFVDKLIFVGAKLNQPATMKVYRNVTITGGAVKTPKNFRDQTVAATSVVKESPSGNTSGKLFQVYTIPVGVDVIVEFDLELELLAGDSLLITLQPHSNNQDFSGNLIFAEE